MDSQRPPTSCTVRGQVPAWLGPRAPRRRRAGTGVCDLGLDRRALARHASIRTTPDIHKTDFTVYTEAGAAFFDGRDPYAVTNPRGWGYLYPPLFAIVVAPLHALPPQAQVLVWFALERADGLGLLSANACGSPGPCCPTSPSAESSVRFPPGSARPRVLAALLPALNCLQRGQVGVAKLYLLLLGFRLLGRKAARVARSLLAGVVSGTADRAQDHAARCRWRSALLQQLSPPGNAQAAARGACARRPAAAGNRLGAVAVLF